MISFFLFLAIWPFHHKKPQHYVITETVIEDGCTLQDGLYYFMAEDGVIAFSGAGCDAAKFNSLTARDLNQWKMSRI